MSESSTGIPSRTAAALAYSGWWITGVIFFVAERQDAFVRRHAAQSVAVFGAVSLLIILFGVLAVASLSFMPAGFGFFTVAAAVAGLAGLVLWGIAMWKAINGDEWKIPAAVDPSRFLTASAEEQA